MDSTVTPKSRWKNDGRPESTKAAPPTHGFSLANLESKLSLEQRNIIPSLWIPRKEGRVSALSTKNGDIHPILLFVRERNKLTELSDKRMCFREHSAGAGVTICERRGATYFAVDGKLSGLLW